MPGSLTADTLADGKRALLRHSLATLAYRGGKAVRGAPPAFAELRVGQSTRTPNQILAHIGDLLDWALSLAQGAEAWHDSPLLPWDAQVDRFFAALERLDAALASDAPLGTNAERIFQGPIADALSHVGQIAMLRRLGGSSLRGENYSRAGIQVGRVGRAQDVPAFEFD